MNPHDRCAGAETDNAVAVHVMGWFYQMNQWGRMAWFETNDSDPAPEFIEVEFYELTAFES